MIRHRWLIFAALIAAGVTCVLIAATPTAPAPDRIDGAHEVHVVTVVPYKYTPMEATTDA